MKTILALASLCLLFTACAHRPRTSALHVEKAATPPKPPHDPSESWLPGTLTRSDAVKLSFRIEKKFARRGRAEGGVAATDTASGEKFRGTYVGLMEAGRFRSGQIRDSVGFPVGTSNSYESSRNATAISTLKGDQGTVIQLTLQIVAGWSPHGIGSGTDNKGRTYQVQF